MKLFLFSIFTLVFTLTTAVFTPADRTELKQAVLQCLGETPDGSCPNLAATQVGDTTYGNIGEWDVSSVTDMQQMFIGARDFNQYIGEWDVSKVETMEGMFNKAYKFNQYIGEWDVSSVTDMSKMFHFAYVFNQAIVKWDVSNVQYMNETFNTARAFNQYIGEWDVSKVENMRFMFWSAQDFNQPIGKWDVSNVKNMEGMFNAADFNQSIGDWNVSSVTDMGRMFHSAAFNQSLDGWYWVKSDAPDKNYTLQSRCWTHDQLEWIPEESTVKCAPGKSYSVEKDNCSRCPVGKFQPDTVRNPENDVDCNECPVGTVPSSSSTACEPCPKGNYCANGIAQPCPAGEYQPLEGQMDVSSCKKCEIDHTSAQGSVVCERCPPGRITRGSYNVCIDYRGGVEPAPDALARSLRRAYKSLDQC